MTGLTTGGSWNEAESTQKTYPAFTNLAVRLRELLTVRSDQVYACLVKEKEQGRVGDLVLSALASDQVF